MPQIPRTERQVGLNPTPLRNFPGSLEAPGRALQGLGRAISGLFLEAEAERDRLNDYQYKIAATELQNDVEMDYLRSQDAIEGDGRTFLSERLEAFDRRFEPFRQRFPEKQQESDLLRARMRGALAERAYKAQRSHLDQYYVDETRRVAATTVLPRITGDPESVLSGVASVDVLVNGVETLTPDRKTALKRELVDQIYRQLVAKADPIKLRDWLEDQIERLEASRVRPSEPKRLSAPSNRLIDAIIAVESSGDPNVVSPRGARGLMQIMPETGREIASELNDRGALELSDADFKEHLLNPQVSRTYGAHYLKKMLTRYDGDVEAALIAYNGGPARADAWLKAGRLDSVLPAETAAYYKKVLARLDGKLSDKIQDRIETGETKPLSFVDFARRGGEQTQDAATVLRSMAGKTVNFEGMKPEVMDRVAAMLQAMPEPLRNTVRITSGFRDPQTQADIVARKLRERGLPVTREALERGLPGIAAGVVIGPDGSVVGTKSRHGRGEAVDIHGSPEALAWLHANSERFGMINPPSIRASDPVHFQMHGAPSEQITVQATPLTAREMLIERLLRDRVAIERSAKQAEAQAEREAQSRLRDAQAEKEREAYQLFFDGKLTRQWVEENEHQLSLAAYKRLMKATEPQPRGVDPATYAELLDKAESNPDEAKDEAFQAFADGRLNQRAFERIYGRVRKRLDETEREEPFVTELRDHLRRTLRPQARNEQESKRYVTALDQYDEYVRRGIEQKTLNKQDLGKFVDGLIAAGTSERHASLRRDLDIPRFSGISREAMTEEALTLAIQKTVAAYRSGQLSQEEYNTEARLLKRWADVLKAEKAQNGPANP